MSRKVTCLLIALLVTSISGCVDKKADSQIQWSTYEDQQGKFSVEYPKDWKVEAKTVGKTYILIFEKSRTTALEISSRELPSTFQDLELTYFLDELAERAKSSPISEPEKLQIGGYDAMKRKYKAEVWGTSMTTTVAVTKLNKSVYLFALHSLSSEFSQNEPIFNHMISSFRSPAVEPKLSGIQATKSQPTTLSVIEEKRLTTHTAIDDYPAWSPDGKKIVFTSDRSGNFDIWVMDADGSSQKQLTINQELDSHPAWSPDGKNIAFWSERLGNRDIWVMDDDGGNQKQLTVNPSYDYAPSWSPDGTKIAFVSNRSGNFDIWIIGVNGQNEAQLTTDVEDDYVYPQSWSPDRKKIVFTSYRSGNGDIWVMDNDGSNKKQLTKDTAWDGRPAWSPDGKRIAFSSSRSGNMGIWIMDSDGSNQRPLVTNQDTENNPSWSPDGKKIVYVRCKGSECNIWIAMLTEIPSEVEKAKLPEESPTPKLPSRMLLVPKDYPTIQAAIDAANSGNTVIVSIGTYYENIIISKDITVRSTDPYDSKVVAKTIIDGRENGTVVTIKGDATLSGFTITNGRSKTFRGDWDYGGGIYIDKYASPTIENNVITNNLAGIGGGIASAGGSMTLKSTSRIYNNIIATNRATYGGGIAMEGEGEDIIMGNNITKNYAGSAGGGIYVSSSRWIINNTISSGIYIQSGSPNIDGNVLDSRISQSSKARPSIGRNTFHDAEDVVDVR